MSEPLLFLDGRVAVHHGDCSVVVKTLADNSIDACVCDPPYALTSIVKRFGPAANGHVSTEPKAGATGAYARAAKGFMGKDWDNGSTAFSVDFWREVWRVLKPGAHVVAFGGTRTYHRLAVAIEDAGFECRDAVMWHYGTGFPKSHDVSKGIDRIGPNRDHIAIPEFGKHYAERRKTAGMTHAQICELGGFYGEVNHGGTSANWESGLSLPTVEQWDIIAPILGLDANFKERVAREQYEREVLGLRYVHRGVAFTSEGPAAIHVTAPGCDASRKWEGWGTALKPATEIIFVGRKPLSEPTVAANVLRWGCGALNIDACRVETGESLNGGAYCGEIRNRAEYSSSDSAPGAIPMSRLNRGVGDFKQPIGRWPANICHDNSPQVIAAFPDEAGGSSGGAFTNHNAGRYGAIGDRGNGAPISRNDSGSAARFFYSARADSDDRLGSKHPTVKPVSLCRWLARLVTPKGGTILDPFAGTGTLGEAAYLEGFNAVLIEREIEYQADIARRMSLVLSGPDERRNARMKMSGKAQDAGPLFAEGVL